MKTSSDMLDASEYNKLLKPSENHPKVLYSAADPGLYSKLLMKYTGSQKHKIEHHEAGH